MEGNELSVERVRALCPIDLPGLTAWSRARWVVVFVLVATTAGVIGVALDSFAYAGLILIFAPQVLAALRAVETLDSVEVLRVAVDDGWFQAMCQLRTSELSYGPVGVLTVAGGILRLEFERHEEWPAHLVRLGREPGLWGAGQVILETPDGARRITFVRQSSIVATWRSAVDRSVHRVLARALAN